MTKGGLRRAVRKTPLGREALLVEVQPRPPEVGLEDPNPVSGEFELGEALLRFGDTAK